MSSNPSFTLNEIRRKLQRLGFSLKRSGPHEIWRKGGAIVALSHGNDEVGKDLLRSICHQARITVDQLTDA